MTYEVVLVDPKISQKVRIFNGTLCFIFMYILSYYAIQILCSIATIFLNLIGISFPKSFLYLLIGVGFIVGGYEDIKKSGYEEKLKEDLKSLYHKII